MTNRRRENDPNFTYVKINRDALGFISVALQRELQMQRRIAASSKSTPRAQASASVNAYIVEEALADIFESIRPVEAPAPDPETPGS